MSFDERQLIWHRLGNEMTARAIGGTLAFGKSGKLAFESELKDNVNRRLKSCTE